MIMSEKKSDSLLYIEECIKWNSDGNFDRVSAAGMLFILREERYKRTEVIKANQDVKFKHIANDSFFERNYTLQNAIKNQHKRFKNL